jgi:hypothetical protein
VLLLDDRTGPSVFGDVGVEASAEIGRNITVDENILRIAVPPVPVEASVEIDAGRESRIVDIDPFVGRGLHIDSHGPINHGTFDHRPLHRNSSRKDWRADGNDASEHEGRRDSRRRYDE